MTKIQESLWLSINHNKVLPLGWEDLVAESNRMTKCSMKILITGVGLDKVMNTLSRIALKKSRYIVLVPLHIMFAVNLMDPDNVGTTRLLSNNTAGPICFVAVVCIVSSFVISTTFSKPPQDVLIVHLFPVRMFFPIVLGIVFFRWPILTASKEVWVVRDFAQVSSDEKFKRVVLFVCLLSSDSILFVLNRRLPSSNVFLPSLFPTLSVVQKDFLSRFDITQSYNLH
mmetsp:Transcript_10988/g.19917  ORF Transcript_10988/g.19917 Transcript_10988/m.19917 type:complete len:227 (-) Transcript_10988:903-1583(-)